MGDDNDPPWFKSLTGQKQAFKYYRNKTNIQLLNILNFLKERLNVLIIINIIIVKILGIHFLNYFSLCK